jgi:hypothetical protein
MARPLRDGLASSTSGPSSVTGVSTPGYTSFCNRSGTWSAHEFRADFIKAPAQDYPQPILADIQSAPRWYGVERFTPGHYPTHGPGFFAQEQRLWGRGGQNRFPKPKNLFTCQLKIYLIAFSIAERLNRAAQHV